MERLNRLPLAAGMIITTWLFTFFVGIESEASFGVSVGITSAALAMMGPR